MTTQQSLTKEYQYLLTIRILKHLFQTDAPAAEIDPSNYAHVITGPSGPVEISGPENDNTLVIDAEIDGGGRGGFRPTDVHGLRLHNVKFWDCETGFKPRNCADVKMTSCAFAKMSKNGIELSGRNESASRIRGQENIVIRNSRIKDTKRNGIMAKQRGVRWWVNEKGKSEVEAAALAVYVRGLRIIDNTLINTASEPDNTGGRRHGIYCQVADAVIRGNYLDGTTDGHGITIRSSAVVQANWLRNIAVSGISYYPDHEADPASEIKIFDNVAYGVNQVVNHPGGKTTEGRTAIMMKSWPTNWVTKEDIYPARALVERNIVPDQHPRVPFTSMIAWNTKTPMEWLLADNQYLPEADIFELFENRQNSNRPLIELMFSVVEWQADAEYHQISFEEVLQQRRVTLSVSQRHVADQVLYELRQ